MACDGAFACAVGELAGESVVVLAAVVFVAVLAAAACAVRESAGDAVQLLHACVDGFEQLLHVDESPLAAFVIGVDAVFLIEVLVVFSLVPYVGLIFVARFSL